MALLAVSDLHVAEPANRRLVAEFRAQNDDDWLIVAGDVGEREEDVLETLALLAGRFERVIWVPGNHELWAETRVPDGQPTDRPQTGPERYERLVAGAQALGVVTPEDDPYPRWHDGTSELVIVPMLLLYDYSFRPAGSSAEEALQASKHAGVVCADEHLIRPGRYGSVQAWSEARVESTQRRLDQLPPTHSTVLVNHHPLVRHLAMSPTLPHLELWSGTERTRSWHLRYRARSVVFGHTHRPRTTWHDGVAFEEVSLGHERERRRHGGPWGLREILPRPQGADAGRFNDLVTSEPR